MEPYFFLSQSQHSDLSGKKVLLRLDLDVIKNKSGYDFERLHASIDTIKLLISARVTKIGIIGHLGRPAGRPSRSLSVRPMFKELQKVFRPGESRLFKFYENLRFNPGEEDDSVEFATSISRGYDLYVFDAFAVSHRKHASVVSIPTLLPTYLGLNVEQELKNLSRLFAPSRPYLAIVGGAKPETKIELIQSLSKNADMILIGGALAKQEFHELYQNYKNVIVAKLNEGELDLSQEAVKTVKQYIATASTIVWNGPMGRTEVQQFAKGSKIVAEAIQQSSAFSIIGGGDTVSFFRQNNFKTNSHSYLCMGGGAMLHYITHGTLPLIEVLEKRNINE